MVGHATNSETPIIINCYSSGKISGTNPGGLMGAQGWMTIAGTGINSYYLLSDTVSNSVGNPSQTIESTALTEVTQDILDNLNKYIEEDPDSVGTTGWAKWFFDENLEPTLDFTTTWDGTQWVEK